jgi:hypothetical protein
VLATTAFLIALDVDGLSDCHGLLLCFLIQW